MSPPEQDPPRSDTVELDLAAEHGPVRLKAALPTLREALESAKGDEASRREVVRQLAAYGGPEVAQIFAVAAQQPGNADLLPTIVRALGYVHDAAAFEIAAGFVLHPEPGVSGAAVKALMSLDRAAALRKVASALGKGSNAQARDIAKVMGERFPKEAGKLGRVLLAGKTAKGRMAAHLLWRYISDDIGRSQAIHALRMERDPAVFEAALGLLLRATTPEQRGKVDRFRAELASKLAVLDKVIANPAGGTGKAAAIPSDTAAAIDMPALEVAAAAARAAAGVGLGAGIPTMASPSAGAGVVGAGVAAAGVASAVPEVLGGTGVSPARPGKSVPGAGFSVPGTAPAQSALDAGATGGQTTGAVDTPAHTAPPTAESRGVARPSGAGPAFDASRPRGTPTRPEPATEKPPPGQGSRLREVLTRPMVVIGFLMVAVCYGLSAMGIWPGADTGAPALHSTPEITTCALGKVGQKLTVTGELAEANAQTSTVLVLVRDKGMMVAATFKDQPVGHFQLGRTVTISGTLREVKNPKVAIVDGVTIAQ